MHILYVGGRDFGEYHQTQGVHQEVPFTSTHQFSAIKTSFFAAFGAFGRLRICNHGTRLWLATFFRTHGFSNDGVELFPCSIHTEQPKIMVNRLPGGKVVWQCSPATSILDHV